MPDFRVFIPPLASAAADLTLSGSESHHLVTVNRALSGDPVVAFDGAGNEWDTTLTVAHRRAAVLTIQRHRQAAARKCEIILVQSMPKGGVMENIVRQATEIGVSRIVPLQTARTQVQLDPGRQAKKRDKWEATALEAAKQCGNPWLPHIDPPREFSDLREICSDADLILIASLEPDSPPLASVLQTSSAPEKTPRRVVWLIGPEGDFTPEETREAIAVGATPVSLGSLVLRCDTAATYALAVVNAAFNP
ncbi:RsmE family RNA methyltransferase [Synoicihabitans lomoniglobus]|uniref:Ribosomal RNA small subunit methyltransferase E n=1 Tax=Synoicihabitans lomoniglobus TaxID=2909285 RepID=A0AAF0CMU5_9BACT|nr:16S rRNA (uracil(1498)-N(3))-methyltransferase [Opitutaceae bacterium LMO-M01]WED63560.1 RsmE family RNA methyltransferase [Opitutaceae bacterium LMO-M01]